MTEPQRSYLETLSAEAGMAAEEGLTKAQASKRIEELQRLTGRGGRNAAESDAADDVSEQPVPDPLDPDAIPPGKPE